MSKLPEPAATLNAVPSLNVSLHDLGLRHGTKLFTEAQLLAAVGEAVRGVSPLYEDEQPKTAGCHHYAETCPNCEGMVERWKEAGGKRRVAPLQKPELHDGDGWTRSQMLQVQADAYAVGYKHSTIDAEERKLADETLAKSKVPAEGAVYRALSGLLEIVDKGYTADRSKYVHGALARIAKEVGLT